MKLESKFELGQRVNFIAEDLITQSGIIEEITFSKDGNTEYTIFDEINDEYCIHILESDIYINKEEFKKIVENFYNRQLKQIENDLREQYEYAKKEIETKIKLIEEMEF